MDITIRNMKQKLLFLGLIAYMCLGSQAFAQTVEVKSLSEFSTETPPATITIELLEPLKVDDNLEFLAGTNLSGDLVDVVNPKRLKRNATFAFELKTYSDSTGNHSIIDKKIKAKYTVPVNKKKLAKSAVVGVGGMFVKGLGMGVAAVEGAVHNEEGNIIKSSAVSVYKASPVSYAGKGSDIVIKKNDSFYLDFPDMKTKDKNGGKNYTYKIEKE